MTGLEIQLEAVKQRVKQSNVDIDRLGYEKEKLNLEAVRLEAAIAEEKKPVKLRHGDYGDFPEQMAYTGGGNIYLKEEHDDVLRPFNNYRKLKTLSSDCPSEQGFATFGNIFDDIEQLKKPLERFETDGKEFRIDHNGDLIIHRNCFDICIPKRHIDEVLINLRRLQITRRNA